MNQLKRTPYNCGNSNCRNAVSQFKAKCEYCQISAYGEIPQVKVESHLTTQNHISDNDIEVDVKVNHQDKRKRASHHVE